MARTARTPVLSLVFLLLLAAAATAQSRIKPLAGEIRGYGIYEVSVVQVAHDSGGTGADVRLTEQTLAKTTRDVPLEEGLSFGFDYFIPGQGDIEVTANITAPDGTHLTGPFPVSLGTQESFSYTLGPTLLPIGPGEYDLYLSRNGQRIVGMTFNLVLPERR